MNFKKTLCCVIAACLLFCLAACGGSGGTVSTSSDASQGQTSGASGDPGSSTQSGDTSVPEIPQVTYDNVDFSDVPANDSAFVRVYPGDGTVLFEYVTPGMSSYQSTLVNFSLAENKTLGSVTLGDGVFSVSTGKNGAFTVCNAISACVVNYRPDCTAESTKQISCFEGGVDFIMYAGEGSKLLAAESRSGKLYLVTPDGSDKTGLNAEPGYYEPVGTADGSFVVTLGGQSVYVIGQDGAVSRLFSNGNVTCVNKDYAAGRIVDHLAFLPLAGGDFTFIRVRDTDESLAASANGAFLTVAQSESAFTLRLYRTATLKCCEYALEGELAAAGVLPGSRFVVAVTRVSAGYAYELLDTAMWKDSAVPVESDLSTVLGEVTLPPVGSADEADSYAKQILDEWNVRFLYEPCEFIDSLSEIGVTMTMCEDRSAILKAEKDVIETFPFLPEAVWKKVGGDSPLLVILCEDIPGSVAGWNFEWAGSNVIVIEIDCSPEIYTHNFVHETGHAIDRIVYKTASALIGEWDSLTPGYVIEALERGTVDGVNVITNEFTPYDKSGNVYYTNYYAMTNPEEDRAETIAYFYNAVFLGEDPGLFAHEGLKNKALHWAKMIRAAFSLGDETALPFDVLN